MFFCTVPGPVSNLSVVPGVVLVNISWNPPSERNGIIVVYELGFAIGGTILNNRNTSDTQYTLRDLPPSSFIAIVVRAYSVIGPGNFTVATSITMDVRKCITVLFIYYSRVWRLCRLGDTVRGPTS